MDSRFRFFSPPGRRAPLHGVSLLEMIVVVTLLGVTAALVLVRIPQNSAPAKNACYTLKGHIEVQTQLWYRNKGAWPAADLVDIGADPAYFPEGLPSCPMDGSAYTLDPATHRVAGHTH
jgi:prepilin-type N-terminal cleavage/methylation domain-containing protein